MPENTKPTPNKKLRSERERRCWSQQELADLLGTTPLNVGRWERGVTLPGPHFRQKLCEVFEKSPYELGLVPEDTEAENVAVASPPAVSTSVQATPTALWNVPYRRNIFFTGREDILTHLHDALSLEEQPVAITQPQAISGLGGIGKTQTAIEYAYRYRENYNTVLLVRAESRDLLISDFLTIAALLNLPERNEQDQHKIINAVKRWFDTHEGWLLILDNADNLEVAEEFIPSTGKGHILLTTRAHSTGTLAHSIELEKMGVEEGTFFLLRRTKRLKGATSLAGVPASVCEQAQAIVEAVDSLPLALDQAGAYIEETGCSFTDYLKLYKIRRNRLLRTRGRDASGHPEPVAATWSLSFEKVEQANPAAAELLRLCAFLHPDAIPESMIVEGASELGPVLQPVAEDEMDLNEAIGELRKYSLVRRDPEMKILNVHRLVQAVLRDGMHKEMHKEWAERAVRTVNQAFPKVESALWPMCQQYLPHAQNCVELIGHYHMILPESTHLLMQTGNYLRERAQYGEAEPLLQRATALCEQQFGSDHPDTALSIHILGILYYYQGKYEQAESLYLQALAIRQQALGLTHPDVAESLNDLAVLYWEQDKYEQAESFYLRALTIREQVLPSHHAAVAESLNNLAVLYWQQNKYAQAEPLYLRAIAIEEQSLGPNHPDLASDLSNLAKLYQSQGKYKEAEVLCLRALNIFEQVLGPNHPKVAETLGRLSYIYRKLYREQEAESILLRALTIEEQDAGLNPSLIAGTLNHLGQLYYDQGKYEQAEPLLLRSLTIREQFRGPQHSDTAISLNSLAKLYCSWEKYEQAEPLFQRALAIREQKFGMEHPDVATVLENYADLLHKTNRESEATSMKARAQAIRAQKA